MGSAYLRHIHGWTAVPDAAFTRWHRHLKRMKTETETPLVQLPESPPPTADAGREHDLQPHPLGYCLKRLVLGRPLPTKALAHERLGKPTALAIFSSDALSSVAYGTEEMLRALIPIAGVAAFALVMPITGVIALVLLTLMFSYRQTIKAYPSAGGAYIVTKDNFGLIPAQVAGVALLTDYVMTVAVSISAGVQALTSVETGLYPWRVPICLAFVLIIAWGNLRGVRESGRMFAAPTYIFLISVFLLLVTAAVRYAFFGGVPQASLPTSWYGPAAPPAAGLFQGVALLVVLRALAHGSTAMTGVEAISNGIPAFKKPEWRNARATLMWMGSLLGIMFLGTSFLAHKLQVAPDPAAVKSVLSIIGSQVFGDTAAGHAMYLILQASTMLILVLAANTAFAHFPRLANFAAGDSFMPRQMTTRGHRLVFSNGVIGLAVVSSLLIVIFGATVDRLIPFYAIGVFTSFTLSQAGMARRHLRLKEPGWHHGLVINAAGAVATGIICVVVAVMKFTQGAWVILVLVPVGVLLLVRMNRRYEGEREELNSGLEGLDRSKAHRPVALLLVGELDHKTLHALQYVRTIRPQEARAVHFEQEGESSALLKAQWDKRELDIPLTIVKATSDVPSCLAGYVGALPEGLDVSVILPAPARLGIIERIRSGRAGGQLTRALLPNPRARITLVRDHIHEDEPADASELLEDHMPRLTHKVVVLIDKVDRATLQAVRYALSLGATEVWGVHAAIDQESQQEVISRWLDLSSPVPLHVIECWDRNVARSIESYVAEIARPQDEVTVVIPRRDYAQTRQRLLHDRTSRSIARALGRYAHVDIAVVPYYFGLAVATQAPVAAATAAE